MEQITLNNVLTKVDYDLNISVIVVTSPCPSHPSITLIQTMIESLKHIKGIENSRVKIVCDGYRLSDNGVSFKRGRISKEVAANYESYLINLQEYFKIDKNLDIIINKEHLGFAYSVREGLLQCNTKFALICQHDRLFVGPFVCLSEVLKIMEENSHIRYIGFPTSSTMTHHEIILSKYLLSELAKTCYDIPVNSEISLQPMIFWYDSNHIACIERYLEIYTPYKSLISTNLIPSNAKDKINLKKLASQLTLRKGDFIEDKFGQAQKIFICSASNDSELQVQYFLFFGSYQLIWPQLKKSNDVQILTEDFEDPNPHNIFEMENIENNILKGRTVVFHMKGRFTSNKEMMRYQGFTTNSLQTLKKYF